MNSIAIAESMNYTFILIGLGLLLGGTLILIKELRSFLRELKEAQSKFGTVIKGIIDLLFLGGVGFFGLVLIFIGVFIFLKGFSLI